MAEIKISELEPTTDLEGLYTIGSDKNNLSKKVSLQFLREAADYAIEQGDYAKQEGSTIESRITDFKAETDAKLTELESEVYQTNLDSTKIVASVDNNPILRINVSAKSGDTLKYRILSDTSATTPYIVAFIFFADGTYTQIADIYEVNKEFTTILTKDIVAVQFYNNRANQFSAEIKSSQSLQSQIDSNKERINKIEDKVGGLSEVKAENKAIIYFGGSYSEGDKYIIKIVEDNASSTRIGVFEIYEDNTFSRIFDITEVGKSYEFTISRSDVKGVQTYNESMGDAAIYAIELSRKGITEELQSEVKDLQSQVIELNGEVIVKEVKYKAIIAVKGEYKKGDAYKIKALTDNASSTRIGVFEIYADNTFTRLLDITEVGKPYDIIISADNVVAVQTYNDGANDAAIYSIELAKVGAIEKIEQQIDELSNKEDCSLSEYVQVYDKAVDFVPSDFLIKRLREKLGLTIEPTILADVYCIPCYGQSLALNTSAGASTFSGKEPLSYDVNLNNNNIQDMCAGTAEAFRIMAEKCGVTLPDNFKIIGLTGGDGGRSVLQLSKGTTFYNGLLEKIKTAKASCDAAGLSMIVPCFTWTQGEEDMRCGGSSSLYGLGDWNPFEYGKKLQQLIDDLNADIKNITHQETDVLCISYQVASHTSYYRYPRIALEQSNLATKDRRMILAKPMYDLDYVHESGNVDEGTGNIVGGYEVHAYARSYRNMGNHYGIAAFTECVLQKEFKTLRPLHYYQNGNELTIKFAVPVKPLVLDTNLVNNLPDGNYGFNVYNVFEGDGNTSTISKAATSIQSISIVGEDSIRIVFNRIPVAGERLTYGINGDYWQNVNGIKSVLTGEVNDDVTKAGHLHGSRGCLRDSQDIVNTNSGAALPYLYNWCVIFEHEFVA